MKRFQKRIEHFICSNCGFRIQGSGFTNHCPKCLWSKHVDVNPGDRAHRCKGMMRPIELITRGPTVTIIHRCLRCGEHKRNKTVPEDNDAILQLSKILAEQRSKKTPPK